jgi:hypothetical protein
MAARYVRATVCDASRDDGELQIAPRGLANNGCRDDAAQHALQTLTDALAVAEVHPMEWPGKSDCWQLSVKHGRDADAGAAA